jgi:hypothetical protein
MDVSDLEASIRSLEASLDALGSWLTFWIVVVVVGLIVECFTVALEELDQKPRFKRWWARVLYTLIPVST